MNDSANYDNPSFLPAPMRILSGSMLKLIACILMLIDHTGAMILSLYTPAMRPFITIGQNVYRFYGVTRGVGRLAFPIFCFLIVEGVSHTRNRFRYGRNLLIFAFISEIPWNIGLGRSLHYAKQNVYFTLFIGFVTICLVEYFEANRLIQVLVMFAMLFVSVKLNADYSYRGYILIMIMYWLRKERAAQALIASVWLKYEWTAGFAFIPINMYNGKRGFIRSKPLKYGFYLFYPVHIAILILIRWKFFGIRGI